MEKKKDLGSAYIFRIKILVYLLMTGNVVGTNEKVQLIRYHFGESILC